ncbi:hypothetical protein PYCC9005_002626 [Savitreella phatthalungensis]
MIGSQSRRQATRTMTTLAQIKKTHVFTTHLPPDPALSRPDSSSAATKLSRTPRMVKGAAFSFVKPVAEAKTEILCWSDACLLDLGLSTASRDDPELVKVVTGQESTIYSEHHPWAQCYGGYQFGQWAGQLGDGRAISLFEAQASGKQRYEWQLKGAGMTPYSRFADGNAVLRSSIREFLVSEHLHALGVPTTRALALVSLPDRSALRERIEPCAMVLRAAQTWLRFGTFDLARRRGDRRLTKALADYSIEHVFGGEHNLIASAQDRHQGNRYLRLYREIVHRTAKLASYMQAFGFMNGVLNTDNTSIFGLSMDYGPFAFMDTFDSSYTPNHDDGNLRYSYKMQPTILWWNCLRLGEALGELMGAADGVDKLFAEEAFLSRQEPPDALDEILTHAEKLIMERAVEFKNTFSAEYKLRMSKKLGMQLDTDADFAVLSDLLDIMELHELDFHIFFRALSDESLDVASLTRKLKPSSDVSEQLRLDLEAWLQRYIAANVRQGLSIDKKRSALLRSHNQSFVLRGWILDDIIRRVEKDKDCNIIPAVLDLACRPFEVEADDVSPDLRRFFMPPPKGSSGLQCSCSS